MKNIYIILLISILFLANTTAQNVEFTKENFPTQTKEVNKALKNIRSGDKIYSGKDKTVIKYRQALDYYSKAQAINPNNTLLNVKIAYCYYNMNEPFLAVTHGLRAHELDSTISYKTLFFKGYQLHLQNQLDEALVYYNKFKLAENLTETEKQMVAPKIKACEDGKILLKKEINCFIDNLGKNINTSFDEYMPIVLGKESILYFVSRKENEKGLNPEDGKYKEQINFSSGDKEGNFSAPALYEKKLFKNFEALQSISRDGKTAIVYSTKNGGDLYEVEIRDGKWMKPKAISAINTSFHETSGSLTANGDTLYFCSNRNDTYGEHDIYRSVRGKKGKWTKPQNLGETINTPSDEISVYVNTKGDLYFSSRGHQGMGGFDIFKSSLENGTWTRPENIGTPVNSPFDDVFFSIADDGKSGYFSSNRQQEHGKQDIYKITFLGEFKLFVYNPEDALASKHSSILKSFDVQAIDLDAEKSTIVQGMVMDAKTKQPLFTTIELFDITENKLLATFNSDSITGNYTLSLPLGINYGVSVKKEGYLYYSENFNVSDSSSDAQTIEQVIMLNKIQVNQTIVLKNIFFDVNKTTLKSESTTEIENIYKLMTENPSIGIEISGHTDNVGTSAYNQKLSQGRALSVVNALKDKGIDSTRMKSAGYGFDKPIAPNTTETGRAQNRRTEFKIIKE